MEEVLITACPAPVGQVEKIVAGSLCILGGIFCGIYLHPWLWFGVLLGVVPLFNAWYLIVAAQYILTTERLVVISGILTRKTETVELYRVKDLLVCQSWTDQIFHTGNISIISEDRSTPVLEIYGLKKPHVWQEAIRMIVLHERAIKGLRTLEVL